MHFNLRDISVYCNGRQYPSSNYTLDYTKDLYARPYHDMQECVGVANSTESNGINYGMYKNGWCFYVFNLTPSMEQSNAFELVREGTTSVTLRFSAPVQAGGVIFTFIFLYSLIIFRFH